MNSIVDVLMDFRDLTVTLSLLKWVSIDWEMVFHVWGWDLWCIMQLLNKICLNQRPSCQGSLLTMSCIFLINSYCTLKSYFYLLQETTIWWFIGLTVYHNWDVLLVLLFNSHKYFTMYFEIGSLEWETLW